VVPEGDDTEGDILGGENLDHGKSFLYPDTAQFQNIGVFISQVWTRLKLSFNSGRGPSLGDLQAMYAEEWNLSTVRMEGLHQGSQIHGSEPLRAKPTPKW